MPDGECCHLCHLKGLDVPAVTEVPLGRSGRGPLRSVCAADAYCVAIWNRPPQRPTAAEREYILLAVEDHPRIEPIHIEAFRDWARGLTYREVGRRVGRSPTLAQQYVRRVWSAYADTWVAWSDGGVPIRIVASLFRVAARRRREKRWSRLNARQRLEDVPR